MRKIIENVRYGSIYYIYILSLSFIFNLFSSPMDGVISSIIFVSTTLVAVFAPGLSNVLSKKSAIAVSYIIVSLSLVLELNEIIKIFSYNTDKVNTPLGKITFCIVILVTAILIAKYGFYNLQRMSNVLFIIPIVAYVFNLFSLSDFSFAEFKIIKLIGSRESLLLSFLYAAIIVFDFYLICFMQNKENCYNKTRSKIGYTISVIVILCFSVLYKGIFGEEILKKLVSPPITAAGVVSFSEIKQVYMLLFSIIILFRLSLKISYLKNIKSLIK